MSRNYILTIHIITEFIRIIKFGKLLNKITAVPNSMILKLEYINFYIDIKVKIVKKEDFTNSITNYPINTL